MQAEREAVSPLFSTGRDAWPAVSLARIDDRDARGRPGPGSVTWRLHGERLAVLGWPRAILLQVAHPAIAAGVARHSGFRRTWLAPYHRLAATVCAMRTLTFGSDAEARQAAAAVNAIHDRVHGTIGTELTRDPPPARYSAHDPALLAWVHVTLLDSTLLVYQSLVGPITSGDRDRYCDEAGCVAEWFGVPSSRIPRSGAALDREMDTMLASGDLRITPEARAVAGHVLSPPFGWLGGPLSAFARRLTMGTLPDEVRRLYGFSWTTADDRALDRGERAVRGLRRRVPDAIACWPESRTRIREGSR